MHDPRDHWNLLTLQPAPILLARLLRLAPISKEHIGNVVSVAASDLGTKDIEADVLAGTSRLISAHELMSANWEPMCIPDVRAAMRSIGLMFQLLATFFVGRE